MSIDLSQSSVSPHTVISISPEIVTADDVAAMLRVSRRSVYRLRARGDIPAPVEVSPGIVRWRMTDIRDYIARLGDRKPRRRD
jgi:predicted DNA-binding transcriptional regulator AlpA